MRMHEKKEKAIINKFQSLLRSGMDYDVDSMYAEAGKAGFIAGPSAKRIINRYYQGVISGSMVDYFKLLGGKHNDKVKLFSGKFNVCEREARLIIRYIKRMSV